MSRHLGPYELIQPLGAGGMAEVWMGRRVAMGGVSKTVAIKLLAGKFADNPEYQRLFMSEARLSMLLSNSNIVQVFDIGEDQGVTYMAMEWVDGVNLAQLCQRMAKAGERLAPVVSVYIIAELLRALAYAHNLIHEGNKIEIIHRDVSPQNVMLSVSGEIKLMDFGIARLSSEDTSGVYVKGKLRYMPPEQLRGNARKPTVDLFAVGAILHELLEFRRFRSQVVDEARLYGMILDGEVPPLELPGGHTLPGELERVRGGLLAAREDERIQTAKEALQLLYRWPGYRNCALDIETLVQRFAGVEAPRTSLVAPIIAAVDTGGASQSSSTQPLSPGASASLDSASQATIREPHDTDVITTTGPGRHQSKRRSKLLVPALVGGAASTLASVVFGGFALGWWGSSEEPEQASAVAERAEVAESAPPSPAPAPAPDPAPAPEPGEAPPEPLTTPTTPNQAASEELQPSLDPEGEDLQEDESEEPEEPQEPAASTAERQQKAKLVNVELVANDYYYVEAKIGGRIFKLAPIAKTKLPAGTHSLYLRPSDKQPWKRAGRITLSPEGSSRVEMLDPPGAKVSSI